jgi:hypothetical protein
MQVQVKQYISTMLRSPKGAAIIDDDLIRTKDQLEVAETSPDVRNVNLPTQVGNRLISSPLLLDHQRHFAAVRVAPLS